LSYRESEQKRSNHLLQLTGRACRLCRVQRYAARPPLCTVYFMRTLWFNQQFDKLPTKTWANGVAIAGVGRGGEFVFVWTNRKQQGKGKLTADTK
jgi:hypothetical protein